MAGPVPAISIGKAQRPQDWDARHKAGHDGGVSSGRCEGIDSVTPPLPDRSAATSPAGDASQPTISLPEKNWAISIRALSMLSEPWTEFSPMDRA